MMARTPTNALATPKAARAYLARHWQPQELLALEESAPTRAELAEFARYPEKNRAACDALRRSIRAADDLRSALGAPANWDGVEDTLARWISCWKIMLAGLEEVRPREKRAAFDDYRLFASLLFGKLAHLRSRGVPGAPERFPGPKDVLALYTLRNPRHVGSEPAMAKAVQRARKRDT